MKELTEKIKNGEGVIALRTSGGDVRMLSQRGIKPLLELLSEADAPLCGATLADKVVGKAAALLFVYGKVKCVHAMVISEHAKRVLEQSDIVFTYDVLTQKILNRDKTGFCPMETKVLEIDDPKEAYEVLRSV